MTDARDIHQIEYRWHHVRDMSPFASSMSAESTRGWDSLIRPWVRHPNVDVPSESVRYQVFPTGKAALAWRYRDRQAAERSEAAQGRPMVSRVLVGQVNALTPDVAIMLCREGLPVTAGPRPGGFADDTPLPAISAADITDAARKRAAELDKHAAREKGLQQVVATALSDPDTPLSVQLRDPYIFYAPREGTQSLLLWGLWRTVSPLTGQSAARRGWSFSTFELHMADMDASTLPDIVFRMAQAAPTAPPVNARKEIRVRPGDLSSPPVRDPHVTELAEWLVSEYQETDGEELRQLIIDCAPGRPPEARLDALYDILRAKWSPAYTSGPASPFVPVDTPGAPETPASEPETPEPAISEAAAPGDAAEPTGPDLASEATAPEPSAPRHAGIPEDQGARRDYWDEVPPRQDPSDHDDTGPSQGPPAPPGMPGHYPPAPAPGPYPDYPRTRRREDAPPLGGYEDQQTVRRRSSRAIPIPVLLSSLDTEMDGQRFRSILQQVYISTPEFGERVEARGQMFGSRWYLPALERHGCPDYVAVLARLFLVLVIPDLERSRVAGLLRDWVRYGPPQVTAALLVAARAEDERLHTGLETFRLMTSALGEAGLQRYLEAAGIPFDWPLPPRGDDIPPGDPPSGGFFSKLLGLKRD